MCDNDHTYIKYVLVLVEFALFYILMLSACTLCSYKYLLMFFLLYELVLHKKMKMWIMSGPILIPSNWIISDQICWEFKLNVHIKF